MQDLMFLTDIIDIMDIMKYLQTLNLAFQGTDKVISDLFRMFFSFQNKI